jgi:hypothetical protein
MRRQAQAREVSIKIPRWKVFVFNFLEKNSEVHGHKVLDIASLVKAREQKYAILEEVEARALKHALAMVAGFTPDLPKTRRCQPV